MSIDLTKLPMSLSACPVCGGKLRWTTSRGQGIFQVCDKPLSDYSGRVYSAPAIMPMFDSIRAACGQESDGELRRLSLEDMPPGTTLIRGGVAHGLNEGRFAVEALPGKPCAWYDTAEEALRTALGEGAESD